jgi:hypothetical protein
MPGKSIEQRISDADERIRQLQARKQALAQQQAQRERKERTRRLIQIGAIMATIGVDTVAKAQALQRQAEDRPEVRNWLNQVCLSAGHPEERTQ